MTLINPNPSGMSSIFNSSMIVDVTRGVAAPPPPAPVVSVATSPDGRIWTSFTAPDPGGYAGVASDGAGNNVAVGTSFALSTDDGATWATQFMPAGGGRAFGVAWDGASFIAVGAAGGVGKVWTSPDGIVWTDQAAGVPAGAAQYSDVASNGGARLVAVGIATGTGVAFYIYSDDGGVTWTQANTAALPGVAGTVDHVTAGGPLWIAVISTTNAHNYAKSADGITWADGGVLDSTGNVLTDAIWDGVALYVAVGSNAIAGGGVATSLTGALWTSHGAAGSGRQYNGVDYDGNQYVAVGSDFPVTAGCAMRSIDVGAAIWTNRAIDTSVQWLDVTHTGNVFIAVGAPI